MKKSSLVGLALVLFMATAVSPLSAQTAAPADQPASPGVGEEVGYGAGSALANVVYIPAKVTYAALGLLTGGLGYVLSGGNTEVASNIIYPAVRGNYVVTPDHLKGREPIYFVGAPPAPEAEDLAANSSSTR
jgi:hypothetical protein